MFLKSPVTFIGVITKQRDQMENGVEERVILSDIVKTDNQLITDHE